MEKRVSFTQEEIDIITMQLAFRCDQLDSTIQEKARRGQNFDGVYELKKQIQAILDKFYRA